jgi:hypothetical protein
MIDSIQQKKALDDIARVFKAAYDSRGFDRADWFVKLAFTGAWFGLFSPWGALKLLVLGGIFHRSVKFK